MTGLGSLFRTGVVATLKPLLGVGAVAGLAAVVASSSPTPEAGSPSAAPSGSPRRVSAPRQDVASYDGRYHFARIRFESGDVRRGFGRRGGRGGGGCSPEPWAHDCPRADRNFLAILEETTFIDTSRELSSIVRFDDPSLFQHPITYLVEPGFWMPSDEELENLSDYLRKGGFLIVDDFRGERELARLEFFLGQALPELNLLPVENDHEIFDTFFRVDPEGLLPPYGGYPPVYYGVFEDNDPSKRMMVMINANNDIAEYWEFSDYGYYGIDLSNEAYKVGVNYVMYALTH